MFKVGDVVTILHSDHYAPERYNGGTGVVINIIDSEQIEVRFNTRDAYWYSFNELVATGKQDVPYDPMIEWVYDPMYTPPHEMPENKNKTGKHKCTCPIQQLMQSGCICKGE